MKFLVTIFLFFISCKEKSINSKITDSLITVSKQQELPTLLIYGEPSPIGYLNGVNPITEKYGFKVKRVAGCEVTKKLIDSVNSNNKKVMDYMNKKQGENWLKNFEKETGLKW